MYDIEVNVWDDESQRRAMTNKKVVKVVLSNINDNNFHKWQNSLLLLIYINFYHKWLNWCPAVFDEYLFIWSRKILSYCKGAQFWQLQSAIQNSNLKFSKHLKQKKSFNFKMELYYLKITKKTIMYIQLNWGSLKS